MKPADLRSSVHPGPPVGSASNAKITDKQRVQIISNYLKYGSVTPGFYIIDKNDGTYQVRRIIDKTSKEYLCRKEQTLIKKLKKLQDDIKVLDEDVPQDAD